MSFLIRDLLLAFRFLLHIWMNRMQNRALKIFPNTFTILKILKFSCFLRRKGGLNQSILWHTITDKAHKALRWQYTTDSSYTPSIQEGDGHFLGLHIQPSTNRNMDTQQGRQTQHSTGSSAYSLQGQKQLLSAASLLTPLTSTSTSATPATFYRLPHLPTVQRSKSILGNPT